MTKMVQENMFCRNSCEIGQFVCWLKFFHPRLPPPIHPQITGPSGQVYGQGQNLTKFKTLVQQTVPWALVKFVNVTMVS